MKTLCDAYYEEDESHNVNFWTYLSICPENPVVPVGNQMERSFPLEIFEKKRNTFRCIPLFLFFWNFELSKKHYTISFVPLEPCSMTKYAVFSSQVCCCKL